MGIHLSFADPVSEANRKKLQTFVENILAQEITENRPPYIRFPGINKRTLNELFLNVNDYRY